MSIAARVWRGAARVPSGSSPRLRVRVVRARAGEIEHWLVGREQQRAVAVGRAAARGSAPRAESRNLIPALLPLSTSP